MGQVEMALEGQRERMAMTEPGVAAGHGGHAGRDEVVPRARSSSELMEARREPYWSLTAPSAMASVRGEPTPDR